MDNSTVQRVAKQPRMSINLVNEWLSVGLRLPEEVTKLTVLCFQCTLGLLPSDVVVSGVLDMPTASRSFSVVPSGPSTLHEPSHVLGFLPPLLHTLSSFLLFSHSAHFPFPHRTIFVASLSIHSLRFFLLTGYNFSRLVSCEPFSTGHSGVCL